MANFADILKSNTPVLIDFYAEWCGPCKAMPPILNEIKNNFGSALRILKIDIDKNQALANRYQIKSVPTLMLVKSGQILWKQSGVLPAHQLQSLIKNAV